MGLGDAVAALYGNSFEGYDDANRMHGTVALVRPDGSIDTLETEGISVGGLVGDGTAVDGSDRNADFRIGPDGIEWRERGDEQLLQETVTTVGAIPVIVFNSGVRDGEHWQDLSGWGESEALRGSVPGEPAGSSFSDSLSVERTWTSSLWAHCEQGSYDGGCVRWRHRSGSALVRPAGTAG